MTTDMLDAAPATAPTAPEEAGASSLTTSAPATAPGYRALKVWQRALDLAAEAHRVARGLPKAEQDGFAADLRRLASAVPAHVAAGSAPYDRVEYRRALVQAQGELARVETTVLLGARLGLVSERDTTTLLAHATDVGRLLRGLARSVTNDEGAARTSVTRGAGDGATAPSPGATQGVPTRAPIAVRGIPARQPSTVKAR